MKDLNIILKEPTVFGKVDPAWSTLTYIAVNF